MKDLIRLLAFVNEQLFRPKQLDNYADAEDETSDEEREQGDNLAEAEPGVYQRDAATDDDDDNADAADEQHLRDTETKVPNRLRQSCLLSTIDSSSSPELDKQQPEQARCDPRASCCAHSLYSFDCSSTASAATSANSSSTRNLYHSVRFVPNNRPTEQISLWSTAATDRPPSDSASSSLRSSPAPPTDYCLATTKRSSGEDVKSRRRRWQTQKQKQLEIEIANQVEAACSIEPPTNEPADKQQQHEQRGSSLSRASHFGGEQQHQRELTNDDKLLTKEPRASATKTKTTLDATKTTITTTTTALRIDEHNRTTTTTTSSNIELPIESDTIETEAKHDEAAKLSRSGKNNLFDQKLGLKFGEKEQQVAESEADDWILLNHQDGELRDSHLEAAEQPLERQRSSLARNLGATPRGLSLLEEIRKLLTTTTTIREQLKQHQRRLKQQQQLKSKRSKMALETAEIETIRASWKAARADPVGAGVLLFKGLFTKFPDYLKFFAAFSDLDLDRMHENKRLLKHAVKVIDTVTFVVDSIGGDESKTKQLNEALVNLVRGHLKRKIGLNEFRNLGIVIIDFICDLNSRRGRTNDGQLKIDNSINSNSSSIDSSQEQTSLIDEELVEAQPQPPPSAPPQQQQQQPVVEGNGNNDSNANYSSSSTSSSDPAIVKLDTSLLVAAWTKLYSSILDLVKREEEAAAAAGATLTSSESVASAAAAAADATTTR